MRLIAKCDSLHDISSDISPQSSSRSQLQARGIHRPFWQESWSAWQGRAEREERSHIIQSQVHKSMQDVHNNPNDHYITGMSMSAQCKLFNTQSQSREGLKAVGNVLLLDGLSDKRCTAMLSIVWAADKGCLTDVGYACQSVDEGTIIIPWLMVTDWSSRIQRLRSSIEDMGGMWYTVSVPDVQLPLIGATTPWYRRVLLHIDIDCTVPKPLESREALWW